MSPSNEAADTQVGWRREAQLILCCAAGSNPERLDRLRIILDAGIDWEVVMRAAPRQGVMPRVYHALIPALAWQLPASVRDRMRREVHGNAVRNCYLAAEMVRLCRLLEKHGVRALALKGPALALGVYGDLTLRQFTDLDLMVRQADLGTAFAVLAGDGFRTRAPLKIGEFPSGWEMTFTRERSLFELDLHWRLSPPYFPFTPEGDELWQRAVEIDLGPGCVSTLGPEDLMLFLCAHGAKHGWQSLSGVCDVARAAHAHQYDWEALAARARSLGSLRIFLLGVLLAHDLLGAAIPNTLIDDARAEPFVQSGAHTFCRYFHQLGANGPGLLQRWLIPLMMIPRRAARLRYALARAFLPATKDFDFVSLPYALSPLYYAIRPLRFVMQKTLNPLLYGLGPSARHETYNR
ncbi:MAG: nucleotidyltransferase family protein [Deltaproteobacteria bacterium]|nr:nucleotidyltransferase family protein [Deltaproteobacteria bacterium]